MTRSRPRRNVTQPDGTRIKILVLREESLREAVPAVPQFVQLRRREYVHVRKRNQLDARRCHRVKTRQLAAGGIEGQRELLSAVAEEIAPGQNIVLVEVMIDLSDHAGKVVEGGSNRRVVRGKIVVCIKTSQVVGRDSGNIVRWVARPELEQGLAHARDPADPGACASSRSADMRLL